MSTQGGYEEVYGKSGLIPALYLKTVIGITAIAGVITVWVVLRYFQSTMEPSRALHMQLAWAWWVVAPPLWFSFEFFYLFKHYKPIGTFEAFKYGQDVASKAWLAIAAVLTAIVPKLS